MAEPMPASDLAASCRTQADEKLAVPKDHDGHLHDDDRTLYPSTNQSTASTYGDTDPERGGLAKDEPPQLSTIDEKQQEPIDHNLVDWDGPHDSDKPTNWAPSRKYGIIAIISTTFSTSSLSKASLRMERWNSSIAYRFMIPGAFTIPVRLFTYDWAADKHVHWIVPIIGTGFVGMGLLASFLPVSTYLIDAFPLHAASTTAASTIMRSLMGALLPVAGRSMYKTLGLEWGNSLLAFIAVAMLLILVLLY
ncbi:MAG: hypothetical protein Q9184_007391 [Pyrenodesmia sp. 2 TL-2023]